jgi:hypothetical protein
VEIFGISSFSTPSMAPPSFSELRAIIGNPPHNEAPQARRSESGYTLGHPHASMHIVLRFAKSLALYLATVAGGVTLFLILAPLFGYLPCSDRPGPGTFDRFPALGWQAFWANAWDMLGYGLFLGLLFLIPGAVGVLLIRGVERVVRRLLALRLLAATIAAGVAGGWMLGAGWYIAAGPALLAVAVALGAFAGGWLLTGRASTRRAVSTER